MTQHLHTPTLRHPEVDRGLLASLAIGVILLLACVPGWIFAPQWFYPAYLFAWMFWLGVSLGALSLVMLHNIGGGGEWGYLIRRFGEAAGMVLPVMFVLFLPIIIGSSTLYPWHPNHPEFTNAYVQHREGWLNPPMWGIRSLLILGVFMAFAFLMRRQSLAHDVDASPRHVRWMYRLSASGMVIYFVLMSLSSVDWAMSREPEWRSTVFGFIIILGQSVSGLCLVIISLALLSRVSPFRERLHPNHLNDLGNLLLTCVILWAYCAFSQLIVTYLGNTQGETTWYIHRTRGPWHAIAALLIVFHFLVPFFLLLMRAIKRHTSAIMWVCIGLVLLRMLDVFWITVPTGSDPDVPLPMGLVALAVGLVVGIGGIWVACYLWLLGGHPLMPLGVTVPLPSQRIAGHGTSENRERRHETGPGTDPQPIG
jgi:hypothetical protein